MSVSELALVVVVALSGAPVAAQDSVPPRPNPREWSSGGILSAEQAAYDVSFYDLTLKVSPDDSTIDGAGIVHARVGKPLRWIVVDLDTAFAIRGVTDVSGTVP